MTQKTRTPEEIKRQIDGLISMKEWLPEYSKFGTPNWENIDQQVRILDGTDDMDDLVEDPELLDEGEPDEIYNAGQEADDWLQGVNDEDLFETK